MKTQGNTDVTIRHLCFSCCYDQKADTYGDKKEKVYASGNNKRIRIDHG